MNLTTSSYTSSGEEEEGWQIIMNSAEECEVIAEGKLTYDKTYGWQHWQVPIITDDGMRLDLRVLTENGLHEQQKHLKELSTQAKLFVYFPSSYITCSLFPVPSHHQMLN